MSRHVHLVKVIVQPCFVVVDTETGLAEELAVQPMAVPATDWPTFYEEGYLPAVDRLRVETEAPEQDATAER